MNSMHVSIRARGGTHCAPLHIVMENYANTIVREGASYEK